MGLIVFRHGQNRDLGNRALLAYHTARPFVHAGQVGVQVAGISTAARDFLTGSGHFTQSFCIVGNIREDNQHVHALLISQILCSSQCHTRGSDTFNSRVIGQVHEQHGTLDSTGAAEVADKVIRFFEGNADSTEDNGELIILAQHLRLTGNLGSQLGMRQAGAGEHRQLLTTYQGVQSVNGGNAGLDKLAGVVTCSRVQRLAVNVHPLFRNQLRTIVLRTTHAVEHTSQHIHGYAQLDGTTQEAGRGIGNAQAVGRFEQLHQCLIPVHFQHLAGAFFPVALGDFNQFIVGDPGDAFHQHQRAYHFFNRMVFLEH